MTRTLYAACVAGLLASLTGCGPDDKDTDTTGSDVTVTQPDERGGGTGDPGPGYLEIETMLFFFHFAVDEDNMVIEANDGGTPIASIFEIILSDSGFSDYCYLDIDLVGQTNASWAAGLGAWYGVDAHTDNAVADCPGVDPSYDVASSWAGIGIQAYIATAPDPDIADILTTYYYTPAENVLGGVVDSPDMYLPYPDTGLAGYAIQLDGSNALMRDSDGLPITLPAISLPREDGTGVNKAFYEFIPFTYWTFV